jgi:hypothetical protein
VTFPSYNHGRDVLPRRPAPEESCRAALQSLRCHLADALDAAGVDPTRPRLAARSLGLDKTLMWRLSRILSDGDLLRLVRHVPRQAAFAGLSRALARAGVSSATVERLNASQAEFEGLVRQHAGDRATFELLVGGFARAEHQAQQLEQARRLAFRANSAVWGAQAGLQVSVGILLANAADPTRVDLVHVFGFAGLLRLRSDVRWTLAFRRAFDGAGTSMRGDVGEPLDADAGRDGSALIRAFSTEPFPPLLVEERDGEQRYVLKAGPVGRTGELTALFGFRYRALGSCFASGSDRYGQVVTSLRTPVEHLQFDLLVDEDLEWALDPQVVIHGGLDGGPVLPGREREGADAPVAGSMVDLGCGLSGCASPHMPTYDALLAWVFERLGEDPAGFRAFRFELAYPPIPARVVLSSELLPDEDAARHTHDGARRVPRKLARP